MRGERHTSSISTVADLRLTRRDALLRSAQVAAGLAALGLTIPGASRALGQEATPSPDLSGYQELTVTLTDGALSASPAEISPGYVLLTVVNNSSTEATAGVITKPGLTAESLAAMAATPTSDDEFPAYLFDATIAGGPQGTQPGTTAQAIIQLAPGGWAVIADATPASFFLTVKDEPSVGAEPAADVAVQETEFSFIGLDAGIKSGKQIWKVTNTGAQPHMLTLGKLPAGTTKDQVMALLMSMGDESATPQPGGLQESDIEDHGGVLLQSTGQTVWPLLDLPAGRYVAACFIPDPSNGGIPHAMEGMLTVFDVA